MRLIDADAIEYTHAVARNMFDGHNWNELVVTKDEIEDMPTIQPEITHEQAVAYLQSTGWMQEHDRQMMLDGVHRLTAQPEPHWIPVTERLPKEEDSIFARYYGTDRWRKSMFRKKSREVIVTSVFEDGELHTEVAHTTDGEWHVGVNVVPRTVIAWMPLPEPYKGVTE